MPLNNRGHYDSVEAKYTWSSSVVSSILMETGLEGDAIISATVI